MSAGGNATPMQNFIPYLPTLSGATENPVPTLSTQLGRFFVIGAVCFFTYKLVSTTMTKATLTDVLNISLPLPALTDAGVVYKFPARVENATAVVNGVLGEIASGASVATVREIPNAAASVAMTYQVAAPGIGVLTNTITFEGSGFYPF